MGLPASRSGVAGARLGVDGLLGGPKGLLGPEFDSDAKLLGVGSGRRILPGIPSDPSARAFRRALAKLSRNCLVASFGSEALFHGISTCSKFHLDGLTNRYAQGQQIRNLDRNIQSAHRH